MYKTHKCFEEVPNDTIIWRYMTFDKFLYLLREKKLYFNRADNFSDQSECTLTTIDMNLFRYNKDAKEYWKQERKRNFINCWIECNYELALMWDTYGKNGVAISTSVGKLKESLSDDKEHDIYLSRVKYVDYDTGSSQNYGEPLNFHRIPMMKRIYFNQEKEIRLLYFKEKVTNKKGVAVSVDINKLINRIVVYPKASDYFLKLVNQELFECKLGILAEESKI